MDSSKLIEAIFTPIRLLFVEYPKIIEHYDLRSHERMDCFLPAGTKIKDKDKEGAVLDISQKGYHLKNSLKTQQKQRQSKVFINETI